MFPSERLRQLVSHMQKGLMSEADFVLEMQFTDTEQRELDKFAAEPRSFDSDASLDEYAKWRADHHTPST